MNPKERPPAAGEQRRAGGPRNALFVGIGASAGSLEALDRFFDELPADSGMIVVVVQHLERRHPSALAELLGRHTQMPVQQAEDGVRPQPDHVYIIPPNAVLTLERGALRVATAAETGVYGPERAWLIEGHGVVPDIVIDNLPHQTFLGGDAQLDAAIRYLQGEIKAKPVTIPAAPGYPDKTRGGGTPQ